MPSCALCAGGYNDRNRVPSLREKLELLWEGSAQCDLAKSTGSV